MNQKGFTTVEVLMCFVVVSIIMMSLFSTISAFNEKKNTESYRSKIYEYKNNITNIIQRDIVKSGLTYAKVSEEGISTGDSNGKTYIVDMKFKDGTSKTLKVHQRFTKTTYRINGSRDYDDEFYIEYGTSNDMIRYEIPNLGEMKGTYGDYYLPMDDYGKCYESSSLLSETECRVSKNLQINNILIYITNEAKPELENHILNIYISFYHPDFGNRYAINIVSPIDYKLTNVDVYNSFPTTNNLSDTDKIYYPNINSYKG